MRKNESPKHKGLIKELRAKFRNRYGYRVDRVDGETSEDPEIVENDGSVGDGENKKPDIDACDEAVGRIVRGEAKVGNGDIGSGHSITQYLLFSNRVKEGVSSWLYIIVPKNKKKRLNDVIVDNVPKKYWKNIKLMASETYNN